jgi:hypothetical protein
MTVPMNGRVREYFKFADGTNGHALLSSESNYRDNDSWIIALNVGVIQLRYQLSSNEARTWQATWRTSGAIQV